MFAPTDPSKIKALQLKEAQRALLEHEAAAEFNSAMADMLRTRIARLTDPRKVTVTGFYETPASRRPELAQ